MAITAFVTDGNQRPALAITRSLGRRGIRVLVGEDRPRSLAGASRYCHRRITYPSPSREPGAFAEFLAAFLPAGQADVVFPVTDLTTRIVAAGAGRLGGCRAAVPPLEAFEAVTDKGRLVELAAAAGVPVPHTEIVDGGDALEQAIGRVAFPAVVKSSRSRIQSGRGWTGTTVHYADDATGLRRLYRETPYLRHGVSLVQERIVGAGTGVFALCDHGRLVATFAHRRLREKPPSGGVSVLSESVPVDPVLRAEAARLLSPLGWHGVAMLEYKEDRRRGRPVLIEVNGRFWGSLQLAVDAGVDFPYLAWQLALGRMQEGSDGYAAGVKTRWFLGDVDHVLCRLRHGRTGLPPDAPSLLRAMVDFLKCSGPGVRGEILRRDDPRPAFHELGDYMATACRSFLRRARRPLPQGRATGASRAIQGEAHADIGD